MPLITPTKFGLVSSSDALHLRRDGKRQLPLVEPAAKVRRALGLDAQPDQHQRALGHRASRPQIGRARRRVGHRPRRRAFVILRPIISSGLIASRADSVRYDTPYGRSMHAASAWPIDLAGVGLRDLLDDAAHRPERVVQRQQLMRMRRGKVVGDLRGDRQQRLLIEIGARDRQQQVGGAGTERGDDDAGLAIELAVDRGGDAGVGLVPHQHEIDARLAQLVDQDEHFAAG